MLAAILLTLNKPVLLLSRCASHWPPVAYAVIDINSVDSMITSIVPNWGPNGASAATNPGKSAMRKAQPFGLLTAVT